MNKPAYTIAYPFLWLLSRVHTWRLNRKRQAYINRMMKQGEQDER